MKQCSAGKTDEEVLVMIAISNALMRMRGICYEQPLIKTLSMSA
jgi:hypothetical protein